MENNKVKVMLKLKWRFTIFLLAANLAAPAFIFSTPDQSAPQQKQSSTQKVFKSVVQIKAESGGIFNAGSQAAIDPATGRILILTDLRGIKYDRNGAGVIVNKAGFIMCNLHTVNDAGRLTVTLDDGTQFEGTIVHQIPDQDLAILRIHPAEELSAIEFADSDRVRIGDSVHVIGSSHFVKKEVGNGKIMGLKQNEKKESETVSVIQINFDLNLTEGDSGSPVFDSQGRLLGLIAAGHVLTQNPVYAIPSNIIKDNYLEFLQTSSHQNDATKK